MRLRQVDPFSRVVGFLWTVLSLSAVGFAVWGIWKIGQHDAKQLWGCIGFIVFGGFSAAMGLAIAFEGEPLKRRASRFNQGVDVSNKSLIFHLAFFTAGLAAFGGAVVKGMETGDWRGVPGGAIGALLCLGLGAYGLWIIFKRRRKLRERSLKSAQEVAEARKRRLNSKPKRRRKRS